MGLSEIERDAQKTLQVMSLYLQNNIEILNYYSKYKVNIRSSSTNNNILQYIEDLKHILMVSKEVIDFILLETSKE